jgi:hypothetical protein
MWGWCRDLAWGVEAAPVGEADWDLETKAEEPAREGFDRAQEARVPGKAAVLPVCRGEAIKWNHDIRIQPGDRVLKGLSSSKPMSPNRDASKRSRSSNRRDIRISTSQPSRLSDAGASSLPAGVGNR